MKKLIYSILFSLFVLNTTAQIPSETKPLVFADTFCTSYAAPQPLPPGTVIRLECDTAYVINKIRFKKYEAARKYIINTNNKSLKQLEAEYEQALKEQDAYYKQLMKQYVQADSVSQRLIKDTRSDLVAISNDLKATSKTIEMLNAKLEEVQKLIRKQKWDSIGQKILVALGGIGAGVLIGVVVAH
ncbi:MAG TPA: hypothetical protein VFF27_02890 [Bacteroidia bacterium]|jgi:hypothetical protein|nr:hypothetical protein [Bacteroidia bacterium]